MKIKTNALIYIILVAFTAIFLLIQYVTHLEFMLHVAAIPLEILVAVFVVALLVAVPQIALFLPGLMKG